MFLYQNAAAAASMPPKVIEGPTMTVLTTDEEWATVHGDDCSDAVKGWLCVVEIFADWCGPSDAVLSTVKNNHVKMMGRKIKWYTANTKEIAALEKYADDAKPRFLFYRDGEVMEAVEGINAPSITRCIEEHCPEGTIEVEEVAEDAGAEDEDD